MFGLRVGKNPRAVVTTTPRPIKLIRDLLTREIMNGQGDVAVTRGAQVFPSRFKSLAESAQIATMYDASAARP